MHGLSGDISLATRSCRHEIHMHKHTIQVGKKVIWFPTFIFYTWKVPGICRPGIQQALNKCVMNTPRRKQRPLWVRAKHQTACCIHKIQSNCKAGVGRAGQGQSTPTLRPGCPEDKTMLAREENWSGMESIGSPFRLHTIHFFLCQFKVGSDLLNFLPQTIFSLFFVSCYPTKSNSMAKNAMEVSSGCLQ